MSSKGVGYVIIRRKETNGIVFEEPTVELQEEKKFILSLQQGGTGFVIEKFDQPFPVKFPNYFALGIVITASHTCYSSITFLEKDKEINCGFSPHQMNKMKLLPLKSFCISSSEELYASNGNPYCLPGDIALCLLVSKTIDVDFEVVPLRICRKYTSCSIIGFSSTNVENPISIYPYFGDDDQNAKNKILAVFHKDKALVESKGKVLRNKNLLEISCSAINDMSGAPVIIDNCAVGVFVGGPPLPGQREVLKLASMIYSRKNSQEAWHLLQSLKEKDIYYRKPIFEDLNNKRSLIEYFLGWFLIENSILPNELLLTSTCKVNLDPSELMETSKEGCFCALFDAMYDCSAYFRNLNELSFNTAISTKHPVFEMIFKLLHKFSLLDKRNISVLEILMFFKYN